MREDLAGLEPKPYIWVDDARRCFGLMGAQIHLGQEGIGAPTRQGREERLGPAVWCRQWLG